MSDPGRILIVDDSKTVRLKLQKAVQALGHVADAVGSGSEALAWLSNQSCDVVLLDIVMPNIDGFEVLSTLKANRDTKDLPVIIISGLGDDMGNVTKAIEMGAEDFLPKQFETTLLRARVAACIEKKRLRDVEKEYFRQLSKLTRAAASLESGFFNPSKLGLNTVAERPDSLGKLARVFSTMAQKVYDRERRLRQNIRTIQGIVLLTLCGALWGLLVPLSKMASEIVTHPIGLALFVDIVGCVLCIGLASYKRKMPSLRNLSRADWSYIIGLALIGSVLNQMLIYWMASKLPAFIVAIVIVLEGFAVFLIASATGVEKPELKRFAGLALGIIGVLIIIGYAEQMGGSTQWLWLVIALLIPLTYAAEDVYVAKYNPPHLDHTAIFGLALAFASLFIAPIAYVTDDFIPFEFLNGKLGVIIVVMALAATSAMVLFLSLVKKTGAVFASQSGYVITAGGIGWSILLLGEYIPIWTWAALVLVIAGLIMVEPKKEAEEDPPVLVGDFEDSPM